MSQGPALNSHNWTEDSRYRVSARECLITLVYFAIYTAATIGLAWVLGGGEGVDQLTFVFGFPSWFFWSTLVLGAVFCVTPYLVVRLFFTPMSLAPDPDEPDGQSAPTTRE